MTKNQKLALMGAALIAAIVAFIVSPTHAIEIVSTLGVGVGMALGMKDANLEQSAALPDGAATVETGGIDLGHTTDGDFLARCEFEIEAPDLVVGDLANTETMIYHVYHSDASDFTGEELLYGNVLTQTGAGGAGADGAKKQCRLPVDVKRYVRVKAVNSGAGDASDKTFTARLVF